MGKDNATSSESRRDLTGLLNKSMAILHCYTAEKQEWGVSELARALHLNKATVFRALKGLADWGFVRKDVESEKYRLGFKILELSSILSAHSDIEKRATPYMRELQGQIGGSVSLRIIDGNEMIVVAKMESTDRLRVSVPVGARHPFNYGASGKLLMAALNDHELTRLIQDHGLASFTSKTIVQPDAIKREIQKAKRLGYALSDEETLEGTRAVAAPIKNAEGRLLGTMAVSFPTIRISKNHLIRFAPLVKEAAEKVSHELGYPRGKMSA